MSLKEEKNLPKICKICVQFICKEIEWNREIFFVDLYMLSTIRAGSSKAKGSKLTEALPCKRQRNPSTLSLSAAICSVVWIGLESEQLRFNQTLPWGCGYPKWSSDYCPTCTVLEWFFNSGTMWNPCNVDSMKFGYPIMKIQQRKHLSYFYNLSHLSIPLLDWLLQNIKGINLFENNCEVIGANSILPL